MKKSDFLAKISSQVTDENARKWYETPEQWTFVTDLINTAGMEYDPHGNKIDTWVRWAEQALDDRMAEILTERLKTDAQDAP